MSTDAIDKFTRRLMNVFGEPKTTDLGAYLAELANILGGYSDAELQEAATLLMRAAKYRTWPLPAEMLEAAKSARRELLAKGRETKPAENHNPDPWSEQAKAAADKLINSDLGRKAAHEGWIGGLYSFCRQHRRLPHPREQHTLIENARKFDELYASVCRDLEAVGATPVKERAPVGTWQPAGGNSAKLLASCKRGMEHFLSERNRLASLANGGA